MFGSLELSCPVSPDVLPRVPQAWPCAAKWWWVGGILGKGGMSITGTIREHEKLGLGTLLWH